MMVVLLEILCTLWIVASVNGQTGCPLPWQQYGQSCYLFYQEEIMDYENAVNYCQTNGAGLVSVNNAEENNFVLQQLRLYDSIGYSWYTSGVTDNTANTVTWQGDGTESAINQQWWLSQEDRLLGYSRIIYKTDGVSFGWSRSLASVQLPFVCEILQSESYRIDQQDRDFTYGTNATDEREARKGPVFLVHPESIVVIAEDSRSDTEGEVFSIMLECFADGNPMPTYRILHTGSSGTRVITTDTDSRYTITGGSLSIIDPVQEKDAGIYQCEATNEFGTVLSEFANITFGVLEYFSNVQRAPVSAEEYRSAAIECDAPAHSPSVSYQWFRGNSDFVRPDLNAYLFISSNGKLYFSEVTQNDDGDYHCIVKLTSGDQKMSTDQPPSRISLAIPLDIIPYVPTTWGPEIADGFIQVFPAKPLRGQTIKLECLAYGTLPLMYEWSRKDYALPEGRTVMTDHNRIMEIYEAELEDSGTYYCTVRRNTGDTAQAQYVLNIEASPHFIYPLPDLHADIGSQVTWSCEAKAVPQGVYLWFKNGEHISSVPGDQEIIRNVMTIKSVDASRHAGMYQCAAVNTHGITYSSAQLRVLAFAPSFTKNPLVTLQTAAVGGAITIPCSPEAAPKPEFSWSKNSVNLNPASDDGTSRVRMLASGALHISQLQSGDAGTYCCSATNLYGSDVSCGELKVVQNTVMTLGPSNRVGKINTTSVLTCRASFVGNVDSLYIWRFNDHVIDTSIQTHYTIGTDDDPGALYIRSAQYAHSGIYTCIAKTTYDSVNASAVFTVEGPPGPPAGVYLIANSVTNSSATVVWTAGQEHGYPVEFHNIETCTEYNSTWVVAASSISASLTLVAGTDRRHAFHLENLRPGNSYYFRVRGVNALGIGLASKSSLAYQIPAAAPVVYPSNVGGGGGSVGILKITWDVLPEEDQGGGEGLGYIVFWRLANSTRAFSEEVVSENLGEFATTVGEAFFYTLYEVKVAAFNTRGVGPESPVVLVYSAENIPKGVATNVYAFPYNSTAISVTWVKAPADKDHTGGRLQGYLVNYRPRYDTTGIMDGVNLYGDIDSGIVIGLDPYTWYTFDIQTFNPAGMGPISELYHAKTFKNAPLLYPVEVKVYSHGSNSVRVTWRGVSTTIDEENIEGYTVRYWPNSDDIRTATDVKTERAATEQIVYEIQKDVVYQCRVFGYSRGGDGRHSETVYFTLGGTVAFDPSTSEILASATSLHSSLICLTLTFLFYVCVH